MLNRRPIPPLAVGGRANPVFNLPAHLQQYVQVNDVDQPLGQARLTVELSPRPFNDYQPIVVQIDRALDNIVAIATYYAQLPQLNRAYLSVTMELADNVRLIPNVVQNPLLMLAQVAEIHDEPNRATLAQRYGHNFGASRLFSGPQEIAQNLKASLEEAFENLTNSDETIEFDDLVFELRFDTPMVVGARGKLKAMIKRTIASDIETGGLYKYKYQDGLCGFQAVVYALVANESLREHWTGWSTWFYELFDDTEFGLPALKKDPELFADLAKALRFHMGLPDDSEWQVGSGRDSTANRFCVYQPRMQIVIFNEVTRQVIEQRRGLLFAPEHAKESTILMSYTLGHLHLIRGPKPYFGQNVESNSKFCYSCLLFKTHDRHKCVKVPQCDKCFLPFTSEEHREQHTKWETNQARCDRCEHLFYNSRCLGAHHCRAQHIGICEQCGKKIRPYTEHLCGTYSCVTCMKQVNSDHRCFMLTLPKPDAQVTAEQAGRHYYAFDLESMFRVSEKGGYLHEVNLVVLRRCFDNSPDAEIVMHTMEEFVRWMETRTTPCTLFAHNMKGYDGRMVFDYLFDLHCPPQEILWRGCKILRMTYGKVTFMDTLLHLPASLDELPKMFGLDTTQFKKGYFPYRFNLPENQQYIGPMPPKEYYDPEMKSTKTRKAFEIWYDDQVREGVVYDFAKELREYCQSDVRILCKAIETYMTEQMRNYTLNPFDSITIASYAMAMYRTYFMPENSLCVLHSDEHDNISRSMHGGRTDTRCLLREWTNEEVAQGIYGKYQDVQSLYPTVQFYDPLPVGAPSKRKFDDTKPQPSVSDLFRVFGFVCCDIEPSHYLHHPIIVDVNDEGRLVADLLPKREIVVPTPELHLALRNGYRVTRVYWWYEFKSSTNLFKPYFRTFLKAKIEASGVPDWVGDDPTKWEEFRRYHADKLGIDLDRASMIKNNSKKAGAKLLCNSLWGKFGERNKSSKWGTFALGEMDDRIMELERQWIAGDVDIEFRRYSGNKETVGMVYSHVKELPSTHVLQKKRRGHKNIAVASMITSHARCRLWTELNKLGDRVLYHDTDSIVYEHRPNEYNIPNGRYLGEWEVEEDGLPLVKFVSTGPKCYSYAVLQPDGELRTKTKVKGITLTDYNSKLINYDGMKAMVIGQVDEVKAKTLLFKYNRQHGTMHTDTIPKIFKLTYRKGWIDQTSWKVYPFGWEKFRETATCHIPPLQTEEPK